jgi:[NiFe] hydrogenase diaphorase moiety large subunit
MKLNPGLLKTGNPHKSSYKVLTAMAVCGNIIGSEEGIITFKVNTNILKTLESAINEFEYYCPEDKAEIQN